MVITSALVIEHFWSRKELCRKVGYGVMLIGMCAMLCRLAFLLLTHPGTYWLFILFAAVGLGLGGVGLWLLIPALEKLLHGSKPAISISQAGIVWYDEFWRKESFDNLSRAVFVEDFSQEKTNQRIELIYKARSRAVATIELNGIKGDFKKLVQSINNALSGGKPWKRSVEYTPNVITKGDRIGYLIGAVVLGLYSVWGLAIDDIYIPGKRGGGIHFQGASAIMMGAAIILAAITFLIEIVDHYDRRNNEHWYENFSCAAIIIGWALAVTAYTIR